MVPSRNIQIFCYGDISPVNEVAAAYSMQGKNVMSACSLKTLSEQYLLHCCDLLFLVSIAVTRASQNAAYRSISFFLFSLPPSLNILQKKLGEKSDFFMCCCDLLSLNKLREPRKHRLSFGKKKE